MSTPNTIASSGTITTPPPRPVSAPRKPAAIDPSQTIRVKWKTFKGTVHEGVLLHIAEPTLRSRPIADHGFECDDLAIAPNLHADFLPRGQRADQIDQAVFAANG